MVSTMFTLVITVVLRGSMQITTTVHVHSLVEVVTEPLLVLVVVGTGTKERVGVLLALLVMVLAKPNVHVLMPDTTIGDESCNAENICRECEAGSVVPDGTCNDVNNDDEVGTLTTGDKRCRASLQTDCL